MKYPRVIRDGKVAVLYSPRHGAGWYIWNTKHPECLFDPDVVNLVENNKNDEIEALMNKRYGDSFYGGGGIDLKIEWMDEGTAFEIREYDGNEWIEYPTGKYWEIA